MVPLVGIMFGNVIGGITNYLAYKYEMTQALSSWLVGHFSLVLRGRYEIVWLVVPLVILAFVFANHFNIVGMGRDFSKNLGVPYNLVLFMGLTIAAMITASVVVVVGSISYIGLIVGILGSVLFIGLLLYRLKNGRRAVRFFAAGSSPCENTLNAVRKGEEH